MLSDDKIDAIWHDSNPTNFEARSFARAIERAVLEVKPTPEASGLCEALVDLLEQYEGVYDSVDNRGTGYQSAAAQMAEENARVALATTPQPTPEKGAS